MGQVKTERVVLRRSAFRSWLSSRSSDIVGYACDNGDCPLAMWLRDVHGIWFSVSGDVYMSCEGANFVPRSLPAWAKVFVRKLDFTYPFYNEVRGVEALSILDDVDRSLFLELRG